jgi:hypothetical protein
MTVRKAFDCVEMKWEIQRRLETELAGLSEEEAARRAWERIAADPVLGPFVRSLAASRPATGMDEPSSIAP